MQIHLDPSSGVPIYLQVVEQVKRLVAAGRLAPGEELPPIRALAERLVINPNTAARAYRELERAGVVFKRGTAGTYVAPGPLAPPRRHHLRALDERIDALLAEARLLGVELDELIERVRRRDHEAVPGREETSDARR
jgi:GntR family transcriptional regulator